MNDLDLTVVIPTYNRLDTLRHVIPSLLAQTLAADRYEIVVADSQSNDGTAEYLAEISREHPRVRHLPGPYDGRAMARNAGVEAARGTVVMFTDADLSAPMVEAERLISAIHGGADVAIGSRWLERDRQTIHQPLYRQFFGRCFNAVTRIVMGLPFKDTQCGFKAFKRESAQVIFRLQTIERWGFDPEILFIARKLGYKIAEVPVTWGHDERSRMSYLKDGMKMLEEMALIRFNSLAGRYGKAIAALKDTSTMITTPTPRVRRDILPLRRKA